MGRAQGIDLSFQKTLGSSRGAGRRYPDEACLSAFQEDVLVCLGQLSPSDLKCGEGDFKYGDAGASVADVTGEVQDMSIAMKKMAPSAVERALDALCHWGLADKLERGIYHATNAGFRVIGD